MALWGNNDAVGSGGTVTLDYSNKVVSGWAGTATGTGTTFGQIGAAKTGDIISFGQHGSGTYFGEAVIVSIASSLQCTIASTEALSGAAIAGVALTIIGWPTGSEAEITDLNIFNLGIILGPVVAVFGLIGGFIYSKYDLTREKHEQIRSQLKEKRS